MVSNFLKDLLNNLHTIVFITISETSPDSAGFLLGFTSTLTYNRPDFLFLFFFSIEIKFTIFTSLNYTILVFSTFTVV